MPPSAPDPGAWRALDPAVAFAVGGSRWGARLLLRAYRLLLSPVLGGNCRFVPSCSVYAEQAIERHGCWRGLRLGAQRLLRCHPWGGPGGYDPVR